MGSFADSVLANIAIMKKEVNDQIVDTFIYAAKQTIRYSPSPSNTPRGSPYAEGELINQWYPAYNSYSTQETDSKDDNGTASVARVDELKGKNFFLKKDGMLSLTNNLLYAVRANERGWLTVDSSRWRNAKPYYMVELGIKDAKAKVG